MKRLLVLSILFALGFSFVGLSSMAQSETARSVNPGEDPNEARSTKLLEAEAATPGNCDSCLARLKHMRLGDNTTFRPSGSGSATDPTAPGGSTREGTR